MNDAEKVIALAIALMALPAKTRYTELHKLIRADEALGKAVGRVLRESRKAVKKREVGK